LLAAAIGQALPADPAGHARMLAEGRLTATRHNYDANVRAFLPKPAPRAISSCQSA